MIVTLIGPERYLVAQALQRHLAKHSPGSEGSDNFNLTRLDGARLTPEELAQTTQAIGFFEETRVVVVEGLLSRFGTGKSPEPERDDMNKARAGGKSKQEAGLAGAFESVFAGLPPNSILLLVERGAVPESNTLRKAAARYGKVEEYKALDGAAFERWIAGHAQNLGLRITPAARSMLASSIADLEAISNELDKLAAYVGEGGTVDEAVLRAISYVSREEGIFEMTSAAAHRDTRSALRQLQGLVDSGTSPESILPALAWQIRTLMQVRDMLDHQVPEQRMAEKSGLSPYVVRKSVAQARQFSMSKLLHTHGRLLELDHAVKTGRADAALSLHSLVVEMCL